MPAAPMPGRRRRLRVGAAVACATAALTVASCSSGASAPAANNVFYVRQQVSLQQVKQDIDALYQDHPGIGSFDVQDVQYTPRSRDTVLGACTAGGEASQTAETSQIIACAPLIFFLYSYGRQASVPASVTVAGEVYWYAVTHITGPASARTSLDEVLSSWQLPVPALTPAQATSALLSSVINAAADSILGQKSVHVVITAGTQQIVADIGTGSGVESIASGAASATIRVTGQAAYFTGNPAGLTAYIGMPPAAAAKVRSRWVVIKAGTAEYQDLAAENTMASLPGSILPTASNSVQMHAGTLSGTKVYVLSWKATPAGSATTISAQLVLTADGQVLPVSETLTAGGETKEVMLSRWGEPVTVPVPAAAVPYSAVNG